MGVFENPEAESLASAVRGQANHPVFGRQWRGVETAPNPYADYNLSISMCLDPANGGIQPCPVDPVVHDDQWCEYYLIKHMGADGLNRCQSQGCMPTCYARETNVGMQVETYCDCEIQMPRTGSPGGGIK